MEYIEFLRNKMAISHQTGFEINSEEITPTLYPHVKDTVRWVTVFCIPKLENIARHPPATAQRTVSFT